MKDLSFEQMEEIHGEGNGCGLALAGLAIGMVGAFASFATLNPFGVVLGVGSIYVGVPSAIIACGESGSN